MNTSDYNPSLLTDSLRHQILVEWNNTSVDYPEDLLVHQLFEAQVEHEPDAIAATFNGKHLTYALLNNRANQVANYLRTLGVKPGTLVAIALDRSFDMIICLLGVLKAGGTYVPVDPEFPQERLRFIFEDTQVSILLTQQKFVVEMSKYNTTIVRIDADWPKIAIQPGTNLVNYTTSDNLAYIIYTSGSTGKPKGVQIPHSALTNFLYSMQHQPGLTSHDTMLSVTTITFDIAALELYLPLLVGARIVIVPRTIAADAKLLAGVLEENAATVMQATPATWHLLLSANWQGKPDLKILCGGEALTSSLANQLLPRCRELWNMYGPTETTVWSTMHRISTKDEKILIGRPIANTEIYLLDTQLQPVPIGVEGELYIGGKGLASGYLNRPGLTTERFIPHPFRSEPAARLYRTGDLARYQSNGNIEYLGRIDHQVKIRGFRVELGEIETILSEYSALQQAVVVASEGSLGIKRLIAYVVAQQQTLPTTSELRNYLKQRLPEYMVPSAFILLQDLPLTPNGKVDRLALPIPNQSRLTLGTNFVPPHSSVEVILANIWIDVLNIKQVGIYDNFFELGGDSLLGVRIIARSNRANLQITLKQLYQYPTIAELAQLVDIIPTVRAELNLVTGVLPLLPDQYRFFSWDWINPNYWNMGALLETKKSLDANLVKQVIKQLIVYHDALRLRFVRDETGWHQYIAFPDGTVPFTEVDISNLSETAQKEAIKAISIELKSSLNLFIGPLLRVCYFDLGANKPGRLLITLHHLVVDGLSFEILLKDFEAAYLQLISGETIILPPKKNSIKIWAERLTEYAQSLALQQELIYWLGLPWDKVVPLPLDLPVEKANATTVESYMVSHSLGVDETLTLLKDCPQITNTNIMDILLAAFGQAFRLWTGSSIVLFYVVGHGRELVFEDVDPSDIVGWLSTATTVLLNLEGAESPGDLLQLVKNQLSHISNRGFEFQLLRYFNNDPEISRQLHSLPIPEVDFNYLGQDDNLSNSALFRYAQEYTGPNRESQSDWPLKLGSTIGVIDNQLTLTLYFTEKNYRISTIEMLAKNFIEALQSLITYCQSLTTL